MNLMLPATAFVPVLICLLTLHESCAFVAADNFTQSATWLIRERGADLVCILIRFSAFFTIRYQTDGSTRTTLLPVPADASLTSASTSGRSCVTDDEGYLSFDMAFGSESIGLHTLVAYFRQTRTQYQLLGLQLVYEINDNEFPGHWQPNGTLMKATHFSKSFVVPRGMSYLCKSVMELGMSGLDDVSLSLRDMQFEAFTFQPKPVFSEAVECRLDYSFYTTDYASLIVFLGIAVLAILCILSTSAVVHRSRTSTKLLTASTSVASMSPFGAVSKD